LVYSFGIGEEISFDKNMINEYNAKVFGFDPTPKSIKRINEQELPENFIFTPIGIADHDGEEEWFLPENPNHVSCTNKEDNK
jgi:hypothetical protein